MKNYKLLKKYFIFILFTIKYYKKITQFIIFQNNQYNFSSDFFKEFYLKNAQIYSVAFKFTEQAAGLT